MTWFATATRSVAIVGQPTSPVVKSKRGWYRSQVFGSRPIFHYVNSRPAHFVFGDPSYWNLHRRKNLEFKTQKVFGNYPPVFLYFNSRPARYMFGNASYWSQNRRKNVEFNNQKLFMNLERIPIGRWECTDYDKSEDWTCN